MIDEARNRHPAMVVVGLVFLAGFLVIAVATVVSVVADPMPDPARLSELALPAELEVVDAHQTCNAEACDGEGAVLSAEDGVSIKVALDDVEAGLTGQGWRVDSCGDLARCLRWSDLGVEIVPWSTVRDLPATAAMRANLDGMAVDQATLVYLRVFRCGMVTSC